MNSRLQTDSPPHEAGRSLLSHKCPNVSSAVWAEKREGRISEEILPLEEGGPLTGRLAGDLVRGATPGVSQFVPAPEGEEAGVVAIAGFGALR